MGEDHEIAQGEGGESGDPVDATSFQFWDSTLLWLLRTPGWKTARGSSHILTTST